MNEENREPCLSCMRPMPISEVFHWGAIGSEESKGADREHGKEPAKRCAVKVEGVVSQIDGC